MKLIGTELQHICHAWTLVMMQRTSPLNSGLKEPHAAHSSSPLPAHLVMARVRPDGMGLVLPPSYAPPGPVPRPPSTECALSVTRDVVLSLDLNRCAMTGKPDYTLQVLQLLESPRDDPAAGRRVVSSESALGFLN